jgi:hypothetical protein
MGVTAYCHQKRNYKLVLVGNHLRRTTGVGFARIALTIIDSKMKMNNTLITVAAQGSIAISPAADLTGKITPRRHFEREIVSTNRAANCDKPVSTRHYVVGRTAARECVQYVNRSHGKEFQAAGHASH